MKRKIRDRHLTPTEAARDRKVREQIAEELPELVDRHHERMAARAQAVRPVQPALIEGCEPPRPTSADESVRRVAAERIARKVIEWIEQTDGKQDEQYHDQVREDVELVLCGASYDDDGYALSREMEAHGYTPDARLVEIMDDFAFELCTAEEKAVEQWVNDYGVEVPYSEGQKVRLEIRGRGPTRTVEGTITKIWPKLALVTVFCPSEGHIPVGHRSEKTITTHGVVVPFEQVEVL